MSESLQPSFASVDVTFAAQDGVQVRFRMGLPLEDVIQHLQYIQNGVTLGQMKRLANYLNESLGDPPGFVSLEVSPSYKKEVNWDL